MQWLTPGDYDISINLSCEDIGPLHNSQRAKVSGILVGNFTACAHVSIFMIECNEIQWIVAVLARRLKDSAA